MFFLFSGEGSTDFGTCSHPERICNGSDYLYGPLAVVIDQIVESKYTYSLLDSTVFGFVSRRLLVEHAENELRPKPKSIRYPNKRVKKETGYFYRNARALAQIAIQYGHKINENAVVSVLYRDGDKPNERGTWEDKREAILNGFRAENYFRGVPMIPKSVSEAWMLCAIYKKRTPSQDCKFLEDETHGPGNRHQLKDQLDNELGEMACREMLCDRIKSGEIDFSLVDLDSYVEFKQRFEAVI